MDDHHLNAEQLSRLLDEPPADEEAEHLEGCRRCTRELEGFRRMRMALSAMDQEDPPTGEWGAIEDELRSSGILGRNGGDHQVGTDWSVGGPWTSGWPARAAAAALVFGVGLAAGLQFDVGGSVGTTSGAGEDRAERTVVESSAGTENGAGSLAGGIAGLLAEESGDDTVSPVEDPVMAAEELARLDALARAVRERLRQNPADPELNDLLFRISDRRESLTEEFGRAAQLVSLDYR